jgi:hypothetical protein
VKIKEDKSKYRYLSVICAVSDSEDKKIKASEDKIR